MPNCYYYDEQRNRCKCYVNENLDELLAENAKLVDVLHEVETEAVYAYNCLQQDCVTTANSSEHFFKKWWHAECKLDQLKSDNAKLRDELDKWHRLTAGIELPEYPITEFKPKDLERENAKLRELLAKARDPQRIGGTADPESADSMSKVDDGVQCYARVTKMKVVD